MKQLSDNCHIGHLCCGPVQFMVDRDTRVDELGHLEPPLHSNSIQDQICVLQTLLIQAHGRFFP